MLLEDTWVLDTVFAARVVRGKMQNVWPGPDAGRQGVGALTVTVKFLLSE